MRTHGTLKTWNEAKAFGFIAPAEGGPDVFVHMTAMPRDGLRPRLGEVLSYEVETGADGRLRAARVLRPAARTAIAARAHRRGEQARIARKAAGWIAVALVAALAWAAFRALRAEPAGTGAEAASAGAAAAIRPLAAEPGYACEGRTHCSQMSSCEEATWVLRHCPETQMDGDGDGVPCESQFCG